MNNWIPIPGSSKEKILSTALAEFSLNGFAATNITQLAKKAEVTTGAIYHHFGSKTNLYDVIKKEMEQRIIDRMEGATDLFEDPNEKLKAALKTGLDFVIKKEIARLFIEEQDEDSSEIYQFLKGISSYKNLNGLDTLLYSSWVSTIKAISDESMTILDGKKIIDWILRKDQ